MAPQNHTELAEAYGIPRWSSGFWGSRFSGVCGGLLIDLLLEGAATSLDSAWCTLFTPASDPYDKPSDAIGAMGRSASLPLLSGEDPHTSLLGRLANKWAFWSGSPETGLEGVLAVAAGGPVDVLVPGDFGSPPDAFDHWSRFWVNFPEGSHPVTGSAAAWGAFAWGDGTKYGPAGLTPEFVALCKSVARRYKPVQWVVWDFEYVLSGVTYRSMIRHRVDPAFVPEA